jgi:F-type H+-transporting ATPase subunit a
MGEHSTWFDFLSHLPGWNNLNHTAEYYLGRGPGTANPWTFQMFGETHFTLTHVLLAIFVSLLLIMGGIAYKGAITSSPDGGRVPPARFNVRNFFEMFCDGVIGMMESIMGKKDAKRFFPLIAALAFFIFFSNALALIPGFLPATDTLKTNLALAVIVFLTTHVMGVREHGLAYFKHFLGPNPYIAPLMLPIEIISHIARPISLSLRLMGNMIADHKVVSAFFALIPIIVPIPFLILGTLVVIIQTLVFSLLSMVYISMAVAHEDHH